jgi:hypothetical protein
LPRGCALALLALASLTGLVLTLTAIAFIVVNETQVDLAALARTSQALHPDDPAARPGELISLTGEIAADEPLGDGLLLAPGRYLFVERIVEMYAWERYRNGEDDNGRPRYDERRVWTRSPERGLRSNPELPYSSATVVAPVAHIGAVRLDPRAAELPTAQRLELRQEHLAPGARGVFEGGYLYVDSVTIARPQIGDLRVSYHVVPDQQVVTVFASLEGEQIVPYQAADGRSVLKVLVGDRETALRDLGAVQLIVGWLVRLVASGALWLGLLMLLAGSRRLFDWPRLLGIATSSTLMATVLGVGTALLMVASLWLTRGSLVALAAVLGAELLAACLWAALQRTRATP